MGEALMTAYGVVYDIERTPFVVCRNFLNFHFASRKHMEKFVEKVADHEAWLNDSMRRRFHVEVDMRVLADLQLYMRIETGAFYIKSAVEGTVYRCPQDVRLDGLQVRSKDLQTQSEAITERLIG